MNRQEELYFSALSKDRAENADMLDKPSMRGVKTSVVEKYSDQAHFIYELLQNADDAGATSARFVLGDNELVFAHNGTRRFSVSDPETEDEAAQSGRLGDINAITSIANSNKTAASIGKFGVGFKAVFQYTQTPSVYDPNFYFRIERFIVPVRIDTDYIGRKPEETLFVFPFNHPDRQRAEAYDDVYGKLRALTYPVLFLTNLKEITFECSEKVGRYRKSVEKDMVFGETTAQFVTMCQERDEGIVEDRFLVFGRDSLDGHPYFVGFALNAVGKLESTNHPAFCFFSTKEATGLNFLIHAPFLLTDSREGIKAGEPHNKEMIQLLAQLAADSLTYLKEIGRQCETTLIDDHIFEFVPYDPSKFSDINDRNRISFKPFYSTMKDAFNKDALLPSSDGFVDADNAYWASVPQIADVFSNQQLAALCDNKNAKWVFTSFGREETVRTNLPLAQYIDAITLGGYDHNHVIASITEGFIEAQPISWLHEFYQYVADSSHRTKQIKSKAVFINQDRKAVAAFDKQGQAILFVPTEDSSDYETVNSALLENEDTAAFLTQLGVTTPSLKDEIYNKILPQYRDNHTGLDTTPHFKKFFNTIRSAPQAEIESFIHLLNKIDFILFRTLKEEETYRGKANTLYFPWESLRQWFQYKPDTRFVEFDEYLNLVGASSKKVLISFLTELGVKDEPKILSRELSYQQVLQIKKIWPRSTWGQKWIDRYIDGYQEIMGHVIPGNSMLIWEQLLKITSSPAFRWYNLSGTYEYFFRTTRRDRFDSLDATTLRKEPWLLNLEGELVSAAKLTLQTLCPKYDLTSDASKELLQFLGIAEESEGKGAENYLTDEQRAKLELADALSGIPREEIERFVQTFRAKERTGNSPVDDDDNDDSPEEEDASVNSGVFRVAKEISKRALSAPKEATETPADVQQSTSSDEDDYSKPSVDFSKKIEQAKQRSAHEIAEIARLDELTQQALNSGRYSYRWFKALLELEALNSDENYANSREISITFSKVEREEGTSRTLILKHPSRHIPQSMEDLADIPLELHFANQPMIKVAVEVVSVKSYTLRAKLRTNAEIDGVALSQVTEAKIEAKNPVFLVQELRRAFSQLGLDDDYDMQRNLCENIEFVFGPPGTGKTTHLAREVILPMMRETDNAKVLVLTPTNKAADVLVLRLMESMGEDHSYLDWLVRFGATNDSIIEQSGVFRDKTFDIRTFPRNVTVTTIARFPYDYFMPDESTRLHLNALNWDYIIIDEASMIPLVNIALPLYAKTPTKFVIAGDPFQIEPISSVDLWKNENIYTMVELQSFTKPTTVPHSYHVELLTTQYRSIPEIGEVFSRFAYGGVLRHHRSSDSRRPLLVEDFIEVKPLNIVKFPVSKYESIYRPKRLQSKSNYQVYSALFAFEFVKYLSSLIDLAHGDELFRIGLIAPYRAQADLIDKLMVSTTLPTNINVQVGTIHGFQGDECDIIIALFNPPPSISASKEMFLNKLNIINVSISRARDYLFVMMPDDDTENIGNLTLIKRVEKLCKEQLEWTEQRSEAIEELMFESKSFLVDNSFSTSHQLVNVYGKVEKRYEVRSEDTAVDVQIHET
ncbi:MAG: DEAD/DEAH box helicase family protein [Firmicutes bacterium]|nr:DEAD/DEAH box helicase family protein [Bacillota bacterium]